MPPPLSPVTPIRVGSTSGRRCEEIERADAVPRLQAHEALEAQLRLRVREALAVADRAAVGVADHVVHEDDEAEPREPGRARLQRIASRPRACFRRPSATSFSAARPCDSPISRPFSQCPCGRQHGRPLPRAARRAIQVAGDVMPRQAGEVDLLDRCSRRARCGHGRRRQRRALRHRPQPLRDQHLAAQGRGARFPFRACREGRGEGRGIVEMARRAAGHPASPVRSGRHKASWPDTTAEASTEPAGSLLNGRRHGGRLCQVRDQESGPRQGSGSADQDRSSELRDHVHDAFLRPEA